MADRHTHTWEQFRASAREMAWALASYTEELTKQGMSRDEALYLTAQLQALMLQQFGNDDTEDWRNTD